MPNDVHLIAVAHSEDGLRRAIGEAHRGYTRGVHLRERWYGHLWQGRFASIVMDECYLMGAARYVELNPVRAGLTVAASDYRWSIASWETRNSRSVWKGSLAGSYDGRNLCRRSSRNRSCVWCARNCPELRNYLELPLEH